MADGYVCLWRSAIESEFFHDEWLCKLWMWCLCRANYRETTWKEQIIPAGSFITGRKVAASVLGVTESKLYRGLKRLEKMQMIVTKSNNRFTIITLCNWKTYQQPESAERTTDEQPANNKRTTNEQPANTGEEGNKGISKKIYSGKTPFVPPSVGDVQEYCLERQNGIDPQHFVDYYAARGWKLKNQPMKDWRAAIRTWEKNNAHSQVQAYPPMRMMTDEEKAQWRPT